MWGGGYGTTKLRSQWPDFEGGLAPYDILCGAGFWMSTPVSSLNTTGRNKKNLPSFVFVESQGSQGASTSTKFLFFCQPIGMGSTSRSGATREMGRRPV